MADLFAADDAIDFVLKRVDAVDKRYQKLREDAQALELAKVDILTRLPEGMTADFSTGPLGELRTSLRSVGMADPRIQQRIQIERLAAEERAKANALQFQLELPTRLQIVQAERAPQAARDLEDFILDITKELRLSGEARRKEAAKAAEAAEKRRGRVAGEVKSFLSGDRPNPQLAALSLSQLPGRGPKFRAALEAIQTGGTPTVEVGATESGRAARIISDFRESIRESLEEKGLSGGAETGLDAQELAQVGVKKNQIIDEARSRAMTELLAALAHKPETIAVFLPQLDAIAQEVSPTYSPSSEQPIPGEAAPTDRQIEGIVSREFGPIRDVANRAAEIANEPLSTERRAAIGFDSSAALLFGRDTKRPKGGSVYSDAAIRAARQFSKLSKDKQYQIIARRRLVGGKFPTQAPPGLTRRRVRPPAPPPLVSPR